MAEPRTRGGDDDPITLLFRAPLDENGKLNDDAFDLVDLLLKRHPYENYAQMLLQRGTDMGIAHRHIAALLEVLLWFTPEHGHAIRRTLESWLSGDDGTKIEVALWVDDFFPFEDFARMLAVFRKIEKKVPGFRDRCRFLIDKRVREQGIDKWLFLKERLRSYKFG